MYAHERPNVVWKNREKFVELAAQTLLHGGDWLIIMADMQKYIENKRAAPKLSHRQAKMVQTEVAIRLKELQRDPKNKNKPGADKMQPLMDLIDGRPEIHESYM